MKNKALILGGVFGTIMAIGIITTKSIEANQISLKILVSGLVGASVGGLLFGISMRFILKKGSNLQIDMRENETIVKEGLANHFINHESVGGKLFLTDKRLVFKSHKVNIQKHIFKLDINKINSCYRYKTIGIIPNGLKITTTDGLTEKFVVDKPYEWILQIEKKTNSTGGATTL